jgi:prophage regulatory protein
MNESEVGRLIRLREVERLTGLSKSSVYRLEATRNFPARVKLSVRASAWREIEVREWMDSRLRATSRPISPGELPAIA